jgi:hypothetical protein
VKLEDLLGIGTESWLDGGGYVIEFRVGQSFGE